MLLITFHMLPKTGGISEHIAPYLPAARNPLRVACPSISRIAVFAIEQSSGNAGAVRADQIQEMGSQRLGLR